MWRQMNALPDFSRATRLMLQINGFHKEEIGSLASVVKEKDAEGAAYWIRPEYRKKNTDDNKELFHILMSTAFYFVKGLLVNRLEIRGVGGHNQIAREKLFRHLSKEFGAEVIDRAAGNMIIEL
jgi:hypothetical protein